MSEKKHSVFLISAPSGAGKSSLIELLVQRVPGLLFSISHTTRPPRQGETDGVEYFFVSQERFRQMIEAKLFLEWAQVHGHYYGTSLEMVDRAAAQDKDLLLDVDIQGHQSVRKMLPSLTSIFVLPPSHGVLKQRLIERRKDTPAQIEHRLENAKNEIQHYNEYDYVVINDDLNRAYENLAAIIRGERNRTSTMQPEIDKILASFGI